MEPLYIPPSASTPEVQYDTAQTTLYIRGSSYPSNSAGFYDPLIQWIEEALQVQDVKTMHLYFQYQFINSSSIKFVIKLLQSATDKLNAKQSLQVTWQFSTEDGEMQELGESIKNYFTNINTTLLGVPPPNETSEN